MNWRDPQHTLAGGAELYAWELARALLAAGARVDFVTARERGAIASEVVDGVRVRRRGTALTFYVHALVWLLVRRRRLDVVVDADCGIPVFSPMVLSRRRTSILLLVHHVHLDQFATYFPAPAAWWGRFLEGRVMPRLYRGLDVIAVSASTHREMVGRLGWRERVHIVHNGNAMEVRRADDPAQSPDGVVVLGRLSPHKRVDEVVRAVGRLRERRRAIHLDVVGGGPELGRLRALVDELGLGAHVTVHGHVDEQSKRARLASNRLHVSASDVEGWGQAVIEAAALGLPTLARDVPGLRDSVHDGVTGWLLPEPGPAALDARLAEAIDASLGELDDESRRAEIAVSCRQWAEGFSWSAMHEAVVRLAEEALRRRG